MANKIIITIIGLILNFSVYAGKINIDSLKQNLPPHFSGQIYIEKEGVNTCNYYQGFTNRIYGTLINDSTIFNLGEISHSFVYFFIEHLVSLNQINKSDQVQKYIKNFPYPDLKIKHLLSHESGLLASYVRFYHKRRFQDTNVKMSAKSIRFDNEDIIKLLNKVKPSLAYKPGDSTSYSDMDYLILSSIIEKVTFTFLKDFSDRLFKYQNFSFSPVISAENDTVIRKAFGYRYFDDKTYKSFENLNSLGFPFSDGTNGNQHIYLSAKHLVYWGKFLFKKMDLDILKSYPEKSFFGGFKYQEAIKSIVIKGAFGGSYHHLIYNPEKDLNIAITSNVFKDKDDFKGLINYLMSN